jgi:hypothetical protein
MVITYEKGRALCSPTSALEFGKKRVLSEELRDPSWRTATIHSR